MAAFAVYDSGLVAHDTPPADVAAAKSSLTASGFSLAKRFEHSAGKCPSMANPQKMVQDHDAAHLWKRSRDGHCLLVFRGSNCFADGFAAMGDTTSIFKYGHEIHQKILVDEFDPLYGQMSKADFTDCKTLDVTGHSLGASLATIFAVLSNAGELKLEKYVDGAYFFSNPAVFAGGAKNGRREDGCFPGAQYCNYEREGGKLKSDFVCNGFSKKYSNPKADFVKLGATTGTTACTSAVPQIPPKTDASGAPDLSIHAMQYYLNGQGCSEAKVPVPQHR